MAAVTIVRRTETLSMSGGDNEETADAGQPKNGPVRAASGAANNSDRSKEKGADGQCRRPLNCASVAWNGPFTGVSLILAELLADAAHFAGDVVDVQNHFHHADLLIIDSFIKLCLDFFFTNVINLESQRDSGQRTCVGGVTGGDRFSSEAGSLTFSGAQQNNDVLGTILFGEFLNTLLVFQIHCTSGRSDEALRRGENNFGTGRLSTRCDSGAGDAVTVTDDDDFLAI